jgi:lysophospholipase L1-like esterase
MSTGTLSVAARITLVTGAVVFALVIGEIGMRVIYGSGTRHELEFTRYSLAFKVPGPSSDLSFQHGPNRSARMMGVELRTNADGLRGGPVSSVKPKGTLRVACVGDSLTLGWGVAEEETFCAQIAQALRRRAARPVEGLNFGVGNYNTVMELAVLRTKVFAYHPDVVVIQYYINDAEPVPTYSRSPLAHSYLAVFLWSRVDLLLRQAAMRQSYVQYYRDLYEEKRPGFRAFRESVAAFARECRDRQVPVVSVLFPEMHRLDDGEPFQQIYARVQALWEAEDVPVVNLWASFRGKEPERYWIHPADVHPNGRAFAIAADAVVAALPKVLSAR